MNFASESVIYENPLGSFTCLKAGTWDILFYFPSEGRRTEDFPDARKIQWLRPGLNPRTRLPVDSVVLVISTSVKENVSILLEIYHYLGYFQFKIKIFSFYGT